MTPKRRLLNLLRRNAITRSTVLPLLHGARWHMNPRYFRIYEKYRAFTMISPDRFADNLLLCQELVNQPGAGSGMWGVAGRNDCRNRGDARTRSNLLSFRQF